MEGSGDREQSLIPFIPKRSSGRGKPMVGFFWIGSILSILGGVIIAAAIVSWQIIQWLKYGLWPPLPI